ncbi:MAG: response regulator [Bacteroidota bacterium]
MSDHKQILIVDDEPVWLKVLGHLLETKGYTVKKAASGADALNTLKSYEPDLILLDVRMPDMNGFDLLDHIKKLPKLASKPVVFVSAMDDFHAKKVARELGAADYILKPIDETEVNNVLEKYLPL